MSAKPLLIMISGKMKSGKTSLAGRIEETLISAFGPGRVVRASFAAPLKSAVSLLGIPISGADKDRAALQDVAEYALARDMFTFVKQADKFIEQVGYSTEHRGLNQVSAIIVDDCRYPWELLYGVQRNYLTVRLGVREEQQLRRGAEKDRMGHKSEVSLDWGGIDWDILLDSDVTINGATQIVLGAAFHRFGWDYTLDSSLTIKPVKSGGGLHPMLSSGHTVVLPGSVTMLNDGDLDDGAERLDSVIRVDDLVPIIGDSGLALLADERDHQDHKHGAQLDLDLEVGHRYTMEEAAEALIAYNKWQECVVELGRVADGNTDPVYWAVLELEEEELRREYLAELIDLGACCAKVLSSAVYQCMIDEDFAKKRRGLE